MLHGARVRANALYAAYVAWAKERGEKVVFTQTTLGTQMRGRGFEKKRVSSGENYLGLEVKER